MQHNKRAIVYVRVSTDAQERDGTSLETQERACVEFAQANGWRVIECIRDSASGYSLDRPGIERLRQLLRQGVADVVIAYAVDRVSRNQNHIGVLFDEVQQADAHLEFVTEKFEDTAVGRFILAARAFVAEVEREKIAERTMRGKAERAKSGRIPQGTGKGIYGYRYDKQSGQREALDRQAFVIRRIFEDFANGASCNGIAQGLNTAGEPAFGGGIFYPLTVRRILLNETYTGRTIYRRTKVTLGRNHETGKKQRRVQERDKADWIEVLGATPPIVPVALYERAQAILSDPARRLIGKPTHSYPLRGHLRCIACGTPMVGQTIANGRYRYYRCRRSYAGPFNARCESRYVKCALLERVVREQIMALLVDPTRLMSEARRTAEQDSNRQRLVEVARQLTDVEAKQRRLVRLYTSGTLPEDALAEESKRLKGERERLETERLTLAPSQPALDLKQIEQHLPRALQAIRAWIEKASGDDLKLLLNALVIQVRASAEQAEIEGYVPAMPPTTNGIAEADLVTIERTSASPRA